MDSTDYEPNNTEDERRTEAIRPGVVARKIFLVISIIAIGAIVIWIVNTQSRAVELRGIEETAHKLAPKSHGSHRGTKTRTVRTAKLPSAESRERIRRLVADAWRAIDDEVDREMRAEGWDV